MGKGRQGPIGKLTSERQIANERLKQRHLRGERLSQQEEERMRVLLTREKRKQHPRDEAPAPQFKRLQPLTLKVLLSVAECAGVVDLTVGDLISEMRPTAEKDVQQALHYLLHQGLLAGIGAVEIRAGSSDCGIHCTDETWSLLTTMAEGTQGQLSKKVLTAELRRSGEEDALFDRIRQIAGVEVSDATRKQKKRARTSNCSDDDFNDGNYDRSHDEVGGDRRAARDEKQQGDSDPEFQIQSRDDPADLDGGDDSDADLPSHRNRFEHQGLDVNASRPRPSRAPHLC